MPDVQRLGRVGVPELHGIALSARQVDEFGFVATAGLERRPGRLDPAVAQAQLDAVLAVR